MRDRRFVGAGGVVGVCGSPVVGRVIDGCVGGSAAVLLDLLRVPVSVEIIPPCCHWGWSRLRSGLTGVAPNPGVTLRYADSRPRHFVTETDELTAALDLAASRWPTSAARSYCTIGT